MTKMSSGLTHSPAAYGLDEGSDVDLFFSLEGRVNTKQNLFLFVTTPTTNIP